ncbi:DUF5719 family protein [Janibacter sp. GS2]|uniref:DUF5719 family protein n=1 Tax=Janibacter sp. GS2 TaxID=3442646 RepID=UPI003EBF4419
MTRTWTQPVARVAAVGGLAAAVVLGADRLGSVSAGTSPAPTAERVAATSATDYCPGDPFAADGDDESPVEVTGSVSVQAAPDEVLDGVITPPDEPGRVTLSSLSGPPSTADEKPASGPTSETSDELGDPVMARGTQERAPGLVSGQALLAGGEQASGLAALPCTKPTADAWLIAGGGEKGRQEHLVVTNPGGNAVNARIDVLGAKGDDTDRSVVVPAHGRSVVLLDGIGGTDDPQAVHVQSAGGLVVPTIVDRHLDGLTPAGVETVSPTAEPANRQVLPANVDGDERGMVIAAPGDSDAVVEIRRVGTGGSRGAKVVTVPAGEVVDVELPEVDGVHPWVVESDEPVIAAAHLRSAGLGGESDMSWSVATPAFATLGGVALPAEVPSDVRRYLDVTADDGPAEAEVLIQRDGRISTEKVSLEEGHSTAMPVGAAEAVWVRPTSGSVHGAVLLIGREGVGRPRATSLPVLPLRVAMRDIDVVHQR